MALIIDLIYVTREVIKLLFVVMVSPFALVGSFILLGSSY